MEVGGTNLLEDLRGFVGKVLNAYQARAPCDYRYIPVATTKQRGEQNRYRVVQTKSSEVIQPPSGG